MSVGSIAAPARSSVGTAQLTTVLVAALVAGSAALHMYWPLPADTSWLLTVCERMLAGQTLYADITELNPPMSAWLYMPWVWLAQQIGVAPDGLIAPVMIGVCLASIALTDRILTASGQLRTREAWWLAATIALIVTPVFTFSQREHFAIAFALPMLAVLAARADGRPVDIWMTIVAGVCGGLAMAVKPHFALAFIAPLLWIVVAQRSLRPLFAPETLAAGVVSAAYAGAAMLLHPEYVAEMLPIAAAIYVPNRIATQWLLTLPFPIVTYLCVAGWLLRDGLGERWLSRVLLAATAGFFAAYLIQGRGWSYHLLPALTLATIGFCLSVFGGTIERHGLARRVAASIASIVTAGLIALLVVLNVIERERDELPFLTKLADVVGEVASRPKILLISEDINVGSPFHRMIGATLVNRGPILWMAGNAFRLCRPNKNPSADTLKLCDEVMAREHAEMLEDMMRNPPDIVLAAKMDRDWLAWAREDAETAKLLDGYRSYATVEDASFKVEVLARPEALKPRLRPSLDAAP